MHISWLGSSAMKLQMKPLAEDVTILIDPYKTDKGSFPRNLQADIVLYTQGEKNSITVTGDPFVLPHSGEIEVKQVLIGAIAGDTPGSTIIRIDAEKMSFGHLGRMSSLPTDKQLELLSGVDILCIPVGGKPVYEPSIAAKVVNMVEPRVIIPMCYQSDNDPTLQPVSAFIKEMGLKPDEEDKKVIIKDRDLPQEDMRLVTITKE